MTNTSNRSEPPCWFCNKPVDMGFFCSEFDFAPYHKECGDKVCDNACPVCIGEGLQPCCKDEVVAQ
jgi:hypothetical protein